MQVEIVNRPWLIALVASRIQDATGWRAIRCYRLALDLVGEP
jgi:hypothetical protein